jgi:hypothetical protein
MGFALSRGIWHFYPTPHVTSEHRAPGTIGDEMRERLHVTCMDHFAALCLVCSSAYRLDQLAADVLALPRRFFLCPLCRTDLAPEVLEHVASCPRLNGPWPPTGGSTS